jgi:hypothetical protein
VRVYGTYCPGRCGAGVLAMPMCDVFGQANFAGLESHLKTYITAIAIDEYYQSRDE